MNIAAKAGRTILALALSTGAAATLLAQTPTLDFSHNVSFEIGDSYLLDGDSLVVESVKGPTDTIQPGNVYLVTGTYKLASHPDATLSSNVTSRGPSGLTSNHDALSEPRALKVHQGEGHFSVYLHMDVDGYPHISLYPAEGGSSFAGVYFGTGDALMKPRKHAGSTPVVTDSVSKP